MGPGTATGSPEFRHLKVRPLEEKFVTTVVDLPRSARSGRSSCARSAMDHHVVRATRDALLEPSKEGLA